MPELATAQRFNLAALLDRIVYWESDLIRAADACTVLELVPAGSRLGTFLRSLPFRLDINYKSDGRAMRGASPGLGDVSLREDKEFRFATTPAKSIRAGQWEACRVEGLLDAALGRQVIEVRQVMSTPLDTETTF